MGTLNQNIRDAEIRHMAYLQRVYSHEAIEAIRVLNEGEKEVAAALRRFQNKRMTKKQQEKLIAELEEIYKDTNKNFRLHMNSSLKDMGEYEAGFQTR